MRRLALCMSLAVVTAFPGALAWHGATEPLVGSVAFDGVHWAAWRFSLASTGKVVIEGSATAAETEIAAFGAVLLNVDGSSVDSAWVVTQVPTTHVVIQALGDAPLVAIEQGFANGFFGGALTWNEVPAGEYIAISIATAIADVTDGTLELRASGGATLLGSTDGSGAFAAMPSDFAGTLNARVSIPGGPQAVAILDAAHAQSVDSRLFAFYWRHPSTSLNPLHPLSCTIEYDGPDGGGAGGPYYFIKDAPPGTYTFRVPHCVDVGVGPFRTQLFVVGADVVLP